MSFGMLEGLSIGQVIARELAMLKLDLAVVKMGQEWHMFIHFAMEIRRILKIQRHALWYSKESFRQRKEYSVVYGP
jgi:hypothetical protein